MMLRDYSKRVKQCLRSKGMLLLPIRLPAENLKKYTLVLSPLPSALPCDQSLKLLAGAIWLPPTLSIAIFYTTC